ncbi:MAG: dihydrolipoyl dehydrogenase [Phycisphaerae bacterium]|nr:dihydrolipoyl dehydrogenase [Phycisphaerae bacterium]
MSKHFDIAVIGSGPGGYVAALKAAQMGATVAVVEKNHLGGTCLNNGCIPSKALLATGELLHTIAQAGELGVTIDGSVSADWTKVQKRKNKVLAKLRAGIKGLLAARKVTVFNGLGKLDGPGKFTVTDKDGNVEKFTADKAILATGSTVFRVPGWPDDPAKVCTSDEALHWAELPKRLVIVGGGVIGCEFACMTGPLGVEVTIVEMMPRLLPEMDAELADTLEGVFKKRGVKCFTDTKVEQINMIGNGVEVRLGNGEVIAADKVLVAIGRSPAAADLGLETVGIKTTDRGFVPVNDKMETAAAGYYCIGDANGRCLLAHAASNQGIVAVENALGHDKTDNAPIPWAVYTFPEIAGVGMTEQQAADSQLPISVGTFPLGHLGKAMAANHTEGFVKLIRHRETDALLGVHIIGHNATELIAAAGAMLGRSATVTELAETVFAHPTLSEAIKESAEDALGMALHLPPHKLIKVVADTK